MHYKNGRVAKDGDKVVTPYGMGILHSTTAQSETCNGRLAPVSPNDAWVTIKECLHVDDVMAADIPDSSAASQA